jgi:hypothetical protein
LNRTTPLFDGSLAESLQELSQWRHTRYGITPPKPFLQKLQRCYHIVLRNKLSFFLLIVLYFIAETVGNAGLLMVQWTIEKDAPRNGYAVLIQLTANWPIRVWRSILNSCVLHVILQALKRRRKVLALMDVFGLRAVMAWKIFVAMMMSYCRHQ